MILHCTYEELEALRWGARSLLGEEGGAPGGSVAAPPAALADVERLVPRLSGDFSVDTLAEQRELARAVRAIVARLRSLMELRIAALHPAAEGAVQAYFDFAHAFAVLDRLREMGEEMEAILDVVDEDPADDEDAAESFVFPD